MYHRLRDTPSTTLPRPQAAYLVLSLANSISPIGTCLNLVSMPSETRTPLTQNSLTENRHRSVDSLPRILASYVSLHTLILTGFIWDIEIWNERPALIPSLATTLANPAALHTLIVHIETSYATDESTIDAICGQDVADIASGLSLRDVLCGLTRLEVRIAGVPFVREKWWSTQISERLPCMRDVVAVTVMKIKEVGLW